MPSPIVQPALIGSDSVGRAFATAAKSESKGPFCAPSAPL